MKETIGFIGAGNMAHALIEGWLAKNLAVASDIVISNRTPGKLQKLSEQFKVRTVTTNEAVVDGADVVILAVKPQDLESAVEPISTTFGEEQLVISLAAGVTLRKLKKLLPHCKQIVRLMANTPAKVHHGSFAYCANNANIRADMFMERMFKPLGFIMKLEEGEAFDAFSVASSAGIGFVYELMIYWQEWLEEHGLDPKVSQELTIHTFLGAAKLALESSAQNLEELQARVTSKKGITAAGLDSMRELEIERLLRYSFEKSAMRNSELAQD